MTSHSLQEAGIQPPQTIPEHINPPSSVPTSFMMVDLQKKLQGLQVNAESLCSTASSTSGGSAAKDEAAVQEDHGIQGFLDFLNGTPNAISPPPVASLSPTIKEVFKYLYTISGADTEYPVYAFEETKSDLVIVSEVLLTDMRRKVEEMAVRGARAVGEKASTLEWGRNISKQNRKLKKQLAQAMKAEKAAVIIAEGLQASLKTTEEECDAVKTQLFVSKEQLYHTEMQRDAATEDANVAHRDLKASLEHFEAVRTKLSVAEIQVQDLETTVRVLERHVTDVQTATGKNTDSFGDCLRTVEGERPILKERSGQAVNIEETATKRAEDLTASLRTANEKYQLTKQRLDFSEGQMRVLEKQLLTLKSVATTAEEIAMQRMEELQHKNAHLQTELEAATDRLSALEGLARTVKELSSKNAGLANVEADCQIVVEQVNELEHKNAGLRSELEMAVRKLQESEACNTYLTSQVREYEAERQREQDFFSDSMPEPVNEGTNTSRQGRERRNWSRSLVNLWRSPDGNRDDIDVT